MTADPEAPVPGDSPDAAPSDPSDRTSEVDAPQFGAHLRARREEFESQVAHARENFESQVAQARENFEEANERIKERTGRDLILAILIGVLIGGLVLCALLFEKVFFVPVAVAAAVLGTFELVRALQVGGRRLDVVPQLIVAAAIIGSAYWVEAWLLWVILCAGVVFTSVWRMLAQMAARDGRTYGEVLTDILVGGFVTVYVPFLASLALLLLRQEHGEWWVIMFLGVAVAADTGAYAIGLWLGKHPLAPRVSPKKTWEGFGGAALFATIAAVLMCSLLLNLPWWTGLIAGIVILVVATLGDLGESLLKRDLGIKDMSSWLPGHGGVLDRLDSLLPSAVAGLALFHLLSPLAVSS